MAFTFNFNDPVNSTSGYTSYPNSFVYTDGIPMPTGNLTHAGNRPIRIHSVAAGHATGASGISPHIVYQGVPTGGSYLFSSSGGSFQFRISYSSGTLNFGRNTNLGGTVVDAGDGGTWAGSLVGSFVWSTVASAPTSMSASASGTSITATAGTPSSDGGSGITSYWFQISDNNGSTWAGSVSNGNNRTRTFTGLVNGRTYKVRAYAVNANGDSQMTTSGSVLIVNVPSAPSLTVAQASTGVAKATWTAPANNGASITGYTVQYDESSNFSSPVTGYTGTALTANMGSGIFGKIYFRVRANNSAGAGAWSSTVSRTFFSLPDAPAAPVLSQGASGVLVAKWAAPSENGGTAVTSYLVQADETSAFSSPVTVYSGSALTASKSFGPGTIYFRVRATNSEGNSAWSATSSRAPQFIPDAPRSPAVSQSGPGAATVTWTAPASNGGSAVTGYTVQWSTSSSFSGATSINSNTTPSQAVTGLPGATVYFRVLAKNALGSSGWSSTVSKLMATAPSAPASHALTQLSSTSFKLDWANPSTNGGSAVTGYTIQYGLASNLSDAQTLNVGVSNTRTVTGLLPGLTYFVRVAALNVATTAGAAVNWTAIKSVKLAVEIGNLDGWASFGTLPAGTSPVVTGALRRGSIIPVSGKTGLIREVLATGSGSVTANAVGIQRTVTGLKIGNTYRLTGTMAVVAPSTPSPNTYAFGVTGMTSGTGATVTLGTPAAIPTFNFTATATSHVIRIIMTEATSFSAGWFEGVAFYGVKLTEIPAESPYRLQDTVYEGPLSSHFSLACDSVGASWWVDREDVTKFRQVTSQDAITATFTNRRSEGAKEYVSLESGYSVRNVVNALEINNHGRDAATGDADDLTYLGSNPTSVAEWGVRSGKLETSLRTNFVSRTNFVTNPGGQSTTGYTLIQATGAGTQSTVSGSGSVSPTAQRYTVSTAVGTWAAVRFTSVPVTAGKAYSFSAYGKPSVSKNTAAVIIWRNAANATISETQGTTSAHSVSAWGRREASGTAPALATSAVLDFRIVNAAAVGNTLDVTGLLFEEGGTVGGYFSGITAANPASYWTYEWSGTANNSTSVRRTQHMALRLEEGLAEMAAPERLITRIRWNAQEDPALAARLDIQDRVSVETTVNGVDSEQVSRIIGMTHSLEATRWMIELELVKS